MARTASEIGRFSRLGFRDFLRIDRDDAKSLRVGGHHDAIGFFRRHAKDLFEHDDDEFPGRVVVVLEDDLVETWTFCPRLGAWRGDGIVHSDLQRGMLARPGPLVFRARPSDRTTTASS